MQRPEIVLVLIVLLSLAGPLTASEKPPNLERLDFLAGTWSLQSIDPAASSAGFGEVAYRWFPEPHWLNFSLSATLPGMGRYAVAGGVSYDPQLRAYVAYAVNSLAPRVIEYRGRWTDDSTLLFDSITNRGRAKSRVQYARQRDGTVLFSASSSQGGKPFKTYFQTLMKRRSGDAAATTGEAIRLRLVTAKAKIMSADYRADLSELTHLREEVVPLFDDPDVGYLARYWAGLANWRIAMNGANRKMSGDDLRAHLEQAETDFEASIRQRTDFADGYAAAASVNGWLSSFYKNDAATMRDHVTKDRNFIARAKELEPNNPRVLWVDAGNFFFTPPAYGGNEERGIETYRRAADAAGATDSGSPLPDWGKAEAIMALAYAHLNQRSPDIRAAAEEAQEALRLQPEWSYVRDILLPQIRAAASR
jgi:hypothetical protein